MEVKTLMPVTIAERMEMGEELRISASFDEFLDLLVKCEYRIEYDNGEIISFMGYGTKTHEKIIAKILKLLGILLDEEIYSIYGSNLALHIPGYAPRYLNADCSVIKGEEDEIVLRGEMTAIANPVLIVEVLSATTRDYDLGGKFGKYKKIPSLQQVLYIESTEMFVSSYTKYNGEGEWLLKDYNSTDDEIKILDEGHITMSDVYKNVSL